MTADKAKLISRMSKVGQPMLPIIVGVTSPSIHHEDEVVSLLMCLAFALTCSNTGCLFGKLIVMYVCM